MFALKLGDQRWHPNSVDSMRRAHPHLTMAYRADNFPVMDPRRLDALASAGMPARLSVATTAVSRTSHAIDEIQLPGKG